MSDVDPRRRRTFERNAEQYDARRPSYPEAVVDDVLARSGARRALEIGAGTGKATVLFAARGLDILALEPAPQMAALLREHVRGMRVQVVEEMFETWTGGGFDLVYSAQAFHWIDPAVRCERAAAALRPGGALALIMNEKAPMDPVLRAEFSEAYARWFGWPPWDKDALARTEATWVGEIDASGRFGPVHVGRFPWQTTYTSDQYIALLDTYSDHVVRPERHELYAEIRAAIDRHGGAVEIPYMTLEFFALLL